MPIHFSVSSSMTLFDWFLTFCIGLLTGAISGFIVGKILAYNENKIKYATSLWNRLYEDKLKAVRYLKELELSIDDVLEGKSDVWFKKLCATSLNFGYVNKNYTNDDQKNLDLLMKFSEEWFFISYNISSGYSKEAIKSIKEQLPNIIILANSISFEKVMMPVKKYRKARKKAKKEKLSQNNR